VSALRNVELSVVITDTISGSPQVKEVTMMLYSGRAGSIRTEGMLHRDGAQAVAVRLAVDAIVTAVTEELVEGRVTFEYAAPPAPAGPTVMGAERQNTPAGVSESLTTLLRSGRSQIVSRSADPVTNRSVTVELTATVLEP
jgi:hypothetical protein